MGVRLFATLVKAISVSLLIKIGTLRISPKLVESAWSARAVLEVLIMVLPLVFALTVAWIWSILEVPFSRPPIFHRPVFEL